MRRIRTLTAAGLACLTLGVAAEPVTLTPDQMRVLAVRALQIGDHETTLDVTDALLERDPADVDALVLRSRAARDGGDLKTARQAARQAWRTAETDTQKYAAALVRAQALATGGTRTLAQMWLRQAAQVAPNEAMKKSAVRDFRYVQARNRFQTQLSFSVSPVSNLNNGSVKDEGLYDFPFFGTVKAELGGAAKALSGVETAYGVTTRFRFLDQPKHKSDIYLSYNNRTYVLSDEAKKIAPNAEASDFEFTSLSVTLAHMGKLDGAPGPFRASVGWNQTWYGGEPYTKGMTASLRQDVMISKTTGLYVGVAYSGQDALNRTGDSEALEYSAGMRHTFGDAGHRLNFDLRHELSKSDFSSMDYISYGIEAGLTLGKPVLGLNWDFGLSMTTKHHDGSMVRNVDRMDKSYGATIRAEITPLEYYGFVPTLTLSGSKVESNMGQYDRENFGIKLGLESSF